MRSGFRDDPEGVGLDSLFSGAAPVLSSGIQIGELGIPRQLGRAVPGSPF